MTSKPGFAMKRLYAFSVVMLLASAASAAEMKDYDTIKKTDVFRDWIKGVSDGYMTANAYLESDKKPPLFCSPRALGLNTGNAVDILQNYVTAHAALSARIKDVPIAVVYLEALKDAFPCP